MDCSLPISFVHEISQARILKWIAISFSRGYSWLRDWTRVFCICRQVLYHWATWEPFFLTLFFSWHLPTCGDHLLVSYIFVFPHCSWCSSGNNTGEVCISSSSGPCFVRTLHCDPSILSGPAITSLSYARPFATTWLWSTKGNFATRLD